MVKPSLSSFRSTECSLTDSRKWNPFHVNWYILTMFYQCQASILLFLSALHKCHIFSREPEAKTGTDFSLISLHFLLNRDKSVLFILNLFPQTQFILDFSFSSLQIYSPIIIGCFYLFLHLFFNQAVFYRIGYLFPKLWTFINSGGFGFYELKSFFF